jgi:predicted nuclease of predicted toxin-antitoxin system
MQVKVDEDLPPIAAQWLKGKGYEATTVLEEGLGGWRDEQLWQLIQAERKFLVTADKGFADIRRYPPGTHAGVLLLRPTEDGIRPLLALLNQILTDVKLETLQGAIAVATPRGVRVRWP